LGRRDQRSIRLNNLKIAIGDGAVAIARIAVSS
jgi:hypothetical protein